tara:strand:+ start:1014 stop:2783 length:1770 start_codon:yes stop_codon:yes gene_type:complete
MVNERKLSKDELNKREDIIMNMKSNKRDLVKKYGKDAEAVMYGRATNIAKKQTKEMRDPKITELIKDALKNPKKADLNKDGKLSDYEETRGVAIEKNISEISKQAAELVDGYELSDLERNLEQIYIDMEQEAEPEGGPIADQYADEIHKHEEAIKFIKNKGQEKAQMTYDQAIGRDKVTADREAFERSSKFNRIEEIEDYRLEPEDMDDPDEDLVIIGSGYLDIKNKFKGRPNMTNGDLAALGQKVVDQLHKGDKDAAIDYIMSKINEGAKEGLVEDLDLGHEDNEPNMIKAELYHIGKCAMKLYSILDKFDDVGEVDLPSWWQSKISKSKEALVGAEQYLDFELNEPKIDAVVNATTDVVNGVDVEIIDDVDINETVEDYTTSVDDLTEKSDKIIKNKSKIAERLAKSLKEGLPKGFWDKKIDAEDEDQDGKIDENVIDMDGIFMKGKDSNRRTGAIPTSPGEMKKGDDGKISNIKMSNSERKTALRNVLDVLGKHYPELSVDDKLNFMTTHAKDFYSGDIDPYNEDEIKDEYEEYSTLNNRMEESYATVVNKIKKTGKSDKAAKAIAGAVASYKAKGGGKGPTVKQK